MATRPEGFNSFLSSVKYATLFVVLTFLGFALFEILHRLRIHPVPYLLVGLALCLFYLILLSVSEQVGFAAAYAIGSATPSIESYYNAKEGKYKLIRLTQRAKMAQLPTVKIVDLRTAQNRADFAKAFN